MNKTSTIEILAPVGSQEMLTAAVYSGADAVYLGFDRFNARSSAGNFDAQTLKDAQKYPEKYRSLAVRVSGFSQRFHLLAPELQDHIIARTKHACL